MPNCRKAGLMCVVYLSVLKSSSWLVWYLKNSYVVIFFFFWAMSSLVYIPVYWKGMLYFLLTSRKFVICNLGGPYMSVLRRSRLAVHHTSWYIKMECYILYILLIYSFVICFFFFFLGPLGVPRGLWTGISLCPWGSPKRVQRGPKAMPRWDHRVHQHRRPQRSV